MSTRSARLGSAEMMGNSQASARRGPVAWVKAIVESYRRSWERRAAVAALSALDGHLLKDIGLDRSEILSLVYGKGIDLTRRFRD